GIERNTAVQENTNVALLGRKKKEAERLGYAALRLRRVRLDSKAAILIKLLASTAAPTHNSKRSRPSARQRFMPRPRNSTEMRPSMPARKRCLFLKSGLFSYFARVGVFCPPRCGMHTTLTPFCLQDGAKTGRVLKHQPNRRLAHGLRSQHGLKRILGAGSSLGFAILLESLVIQRRTTGSQV